MDRQERKSQQRKKRQENRRKREIAERYAHLDQDRHHLTAKARHGSNKPSNILWIDIEKHRAWHKIFGLKTLEEVIALLQRLARAKDRKDKKNVSDNNLSEMHA